jgi:hypothetical protein
MQQKHERAVLRPDRTRDEHTLGCGDLNFRVPQRETSVNGSPLVAKSVLDSICQPLLSWLAPLPATKWETRTDSSQRTGFAIRDARLEAVTLCDLIEREVEGC